MFIYLFFNEELRVNKLIRPGPSTNYTTGLMTELENGKLNVSVKQNVKSTQRLLTFKIRLD